MAEMNARLRALTEQFASDIVTALRTLSLAEILGEGAAKGSTNTPARKPTTKATATKAPAAKATRGARGKHGVSADRIVEILKQHKGEMRSQDLRKALGVSKGPMSYHVKLAIAAKRVGMRGTRAKAVYFAR